MKMQLQGHWPLTLYWLRMKSLSLVYQPWLLVIGFYSELAIKQALLFNPNNSRHQSFEHSLNVGIQAKRNKKFHFPNSAKHYTINTSIRIIYFRSNDIFCTLFLHISDPILPSAISNRSFADRKFIVNGYTRYDNRYGKYVHKQNIIT